MTSRQQLIPPTHQSVKAGFIVYSPKSEERSIVILEDGELVVSRVFVDEGVTWKRMRPAPQGRGYRIRKRSNHVTLFVDTINNDDKQ